MTRSDAMTDLPDRLLQRPGLAAPVQPDGLDALSEVLRSVRLTGSMLFLVHATTPWMSRAPAARRFAPLVLPSAEHMISYHVLTQGRCVAGLAGGRVEPMSAGDVLVVPHGDPYFLASDADAPASYDDDEAVSFLRRMAAGELPPTVHEGGGGAETARFICGFLGCNARPFNPLLWALPRVLHLHRAPTAPDRLGPLVALALDELGAPHAGSREVLLRLSELMFIEVLRSQLLPGGAGAGDGLAGLRDPLVGRALAHLHKDPARAWTLQALAAAAGGSRSVLAQRFVQLVGQPPMQYLAAWRVQRAAQLLTDGPIKVHAVAQAVGYQSEAAFSRAFKRHTGIAPSAWLRQ